MPPGLLIERAAEALKQEAALQPPAWAAFARTGLHTEKAPMERDWWYRRAAAVLRKVYVQGPIGVTRLAAEYGGKQDGGSAPYHARRGSRSIATQLLVQLEAAGLVQRSERKGRTVTPKGQKMLDNLSHRILLDLAEKNPALKKYL